MLQGSLSVDSEEYHEGVDANCDGECNCAGEMENASLPENNRAEHNIRSEKIIVREIIARFEWLAERKEEEKVMVERLKINQRLDRVMSTRNLPTHSCDWGRRRPWRLACLGVPVTIWLSTPTSLATLLNVYPFRRASSETVRPVCIRFRKQGHYQRGDSDKIRTITHSPQT